MLQFKAHYPPVNGIRKPPSCRFWTLLGFSLLWVLVPLGLWIDIKN